MARKLSKEEIDRLHEFVGLKDLPYRDLQAEIVDHLASMMEERWAAGSPLRIEAMFLEVYKDFGEDEWRAMWVARRRAIFKQLGWEALRLVRKFYRWPLNILLILSIVLIQQIIVAFPRAMEVLKYSPLVFLVLTLTSLFIYYLRHPGRGRFMGSDIYMHHFALEFWLTFLLIRLLFFGADKYEWGSWFLATAYVCLVILVVVVPTWLRIGGVVRGRQLV